MVVSTALFNLFDGLPNGLSLRHKLVDMSESFGAANAAHSTPHPFGSHAARMGSPTQGSITHASICHGVMFATGHRVTALTRRICPDCYSVTKACELAYTSCKNATFQSVNIRMIFGPCITLSAWIGRRQNLRLMYTVVNLP
jgi:hypothetical protein